MATSGAGDMVLRVGSVAILARLLTPEHFGLVGMVTAIASIAAQISHMGLSAATVQRHDITHRQVSNLFWINTGFGAVLTLILCGLAPLIAAYYREPRLLPITLTLAFSFLFGGLTVQHVALLDRQMKQAHSALIRLGASALSSAAAIYLAYAGFTYWALVWQELLRVVLIVIGIWIFCPWIPSLPDRRTDVRGLLQFGTNLTLAQLLYAAVGSLDRLLLGRMHGPESVGIFRQAQQLIMVPIDQLNTPVQSVAQPGLSILQKDPDRYRMYYRKIVHVISFVTMPLAAFAAVYAEEISLIVLGAKWSETVPLFRIFAFAAFIRPVLSTSGIILVTLGRSGLLLRLALYRCLGLVAAMLVGVHWGAAGMALAHVGTTLAFAWPNLYFGFRDSPVRMRDFFSALACPAIAAAGQGAILLGFHSLWPHLPLAWGLGCGLGLGIITYGLLSLVLPGSREELQSLSKDVTEAVFRRRKSAAAAH